MTKLRGEFECRIDEKGRIIIPVALKKQIPLEANERFMINRGFEGCLNLFPLNEWEAESDKVNQLNFYNTENRLFIRNFNRGATEVALDGEQPHPHPEDITGSCSHCKRCYSLRQFKPD